ncbi:MAG: hypothetical protein MUF84_05030 [Anaerolineae bacterium]|jgi:hypothetical protein|nr:hypothetical protein [Anaerolineae bacterium]
MVESELTKLEDAGEQPKAAHSEREVGKPKNKAWKKEAHTPLPKWHRHQGSSNDCGPYSVMFVVNSLRDAAVADADALARRMEGPPAVRGSLLPSRIRGWATFPWGVARALKQEGLRARWRVGASLRDLWANLNRGRTTIVIVGEPFRFNDGKYAGWSHYKVLYAWDPDEGFAFVDPAADDDVVYTIQSEAAFLKQWTAMGRQLVEVAP